MSIEETSDDILNIISRLIVQINTIKTSDDILNFIVLEKEFTN
ncbi:hypothetical protein [Bacillus sp. BF9-10]|nr:hypothetical protein [Bacillus sp. BF9-10]